MTKNVFITFVQLLNHSKCKACNTAGGHRVPQTGMYGWIASHYTPRLILLPVLMFTEGYMDWRNVLLADDCKIECFGLNEGCCFWQKASGIQT